MGKQKIKTKNNKIQITNRLTKFERINTEELKLLTNKVVTGLLPVTVEVKRKQYKMSVEVSNQIALKSYCDEWMDTDTILSIICGTLEIASASERQGLRLGSLCWDKKLVFVDGTNGNISMLYWPVLCLESSDSDMLHFYSSFLDYMHRDGTDSSVKDPYAKYFYQRDSMNLFSFQTLMDEIQNRWIQLRDIETLEIKKQQDAIAQDCRQWTNANRGSAWLESAADTQKIWLNQEKVVIGRSVQLCDVIIKNDNSVSRRHACITMSGKRYILEDLGSKNGTYIDQKRLMPQMPTKLANGEVIRFGDSCFIFREMISDQTITMYQMQGEVR